MQPKPASRELIILRHAKSSWDSDAPDDFSRPLNRRGQRDAPRIGRWLGEEGILPDVILASPALRARSTALAVVDALNLPPGAVQWNPRIYEASVETLLAILRELPADAGTVLIVGHNPGLESLAVRLAAAGTDLHEGFLKTATAVRLAIAGDWDDIGPGCARLVGVTRPRDIGTD